MESFFGIMKNEMFYGHESELKTLAEFTNVVDDYIDYYNKQRIKSKIKWMPPFKFREASMLAL